MGLLTIHATRIEYIHGIKWPTKRNAVLGQLPLLLGEMIKLIKTMLSFRLLAHCGRTSKAVTAAAGKV
jgi:hypothetical protein